MTSFILTSPQFQDGDYLPKVLAHGAAGGRNHSPALRWQHLPPDTQSLALSCYDPDAPTGSGFWHWYVINLPVSCTELPENANVVGLPAGCWVARNDYGQHDYGGPCPPPGHGPHHYIFTLHALDCPRLELPPDISTAAVGFNVWQHRIASATLTGLYRQD